MFLVMVALMIMMAVMRTMMMLMMLAVMLMMVRRTLGGWGVRVAGGDSSSLMAA